MDFNDAPEEAAFRAEVRAFIAEHGHKAGGGEGGWSPEARQRAQGWREALASRRWVAPAWPEEYGGAGMGVKQQFILNEELAEHGLSNVGGAGVMVLGPTLMVHGSEAQRADHLPRILRGEAVWCQGWSEPGAGSDLAALQTQARRDGDEYVINGQKIWTSGAHHADWMFMLARTDPDAPKHRGISLFLLPVRSPGVNVRPLTNMADIQTFNEVFFEDVRVPATNLVGEENRGWYAGMTLTDFERSGIGNAVGTQRALTRMLEAVRSTDHAPTAHARPTWRLEFADRWTEAVIARLFSYLNMTIQARNMVPNHEASMSKLFTSELNQRIARTNVKAYGLWGQVRDEAQPSASRGAPATLYLSSVSRTIAGGTSEIQRNIIATRGLGLPRG